MNESASAPWQPRLGAWPEAGGVRFRVWAPERRRVELIVEGQDGGRTPERDDQGYWVTFAPDLAPGTLYRYRLDGEGPFPDPASRFQPEGVHGPSRLVDPGAFEWSDRGWTGIGLEDLVVYEMHVGTFTPEGTFEATREKLAQLRDLGVTAVELMPVADFPGRWNWGYDGVDLFAPARAYGEPDDLRRLVDAAHGEGLGVLLDVVYNHLGPDGNYLGLYSPSYFSDVHETPWGGAVNLDGPGSEHVRAFFIENARHWIHEYHLDGLRLDACHALIDESPRHFLGELQEQVRSSVPDRKVLIIAEDSRNLVRMVQPESAKGWGLDAVWADDLHHQLRVGLAGDRDGYYADFSGSLEDLARTIRDGWFFQGQRLAPLRGPPGDRSHPRAAAELRGVPAEPRPGGKPGPRRAPAPPGGPGAVEGGVGAAAAGSRDAAPLHGPGVGGHEPLPLLHRPQPGAGGPGDRGPAEGVRRLPGVRRSGGAGPHSRPPGRGDLPEEPARLGGEDAGAPRGPAEALPGPAAAPPRGSNRDPLPRGVSGRGAARPGRGAPGRCRGRCGRASPGGGVSRVAGCRGSPGGGRDRTSGPRRAGGCC